MYFSPYFVLHLPIMCPFVIDGLLFDMKRVFIFNCYLKDQPVEFACPQHNYCCARQLRGNEKFVYRRVMVGGKRTLAAILIQNGVTTCGLGYIDADLLPEDAREFMASSLYTVSKEHDFPEDTCKQHNGIMTAYYVGQAAAHLLE